MTTPVAFSYAVRTIIERGDVLEAFVAYLAGGHVADVLDAGAESAELVRLEGAVEVRYRFASRAAFERYEAERAPALRTHALDVLAAHGVAPGRGVAFARVTGDVLAFGRAPR